MPLDTNARDTLVKLFAHTASNFPDRPAVSDDRRTLTYAELDRLSDDMAAQLHARGVRLEERVGVYLDRTVDVFIAILGILKAGGAYVAVDTRYPDAHRDLLLRQSRSKVVLSRPAWCAKLSHLPMDIIPMPVSGEVSMDRATAPAPFLPATVGPRDAASLLFTSGSSGTPKAVILEHGNIVSFACNPSLPALTPEDRVGQISSLSFDAFHFEAWATFAQGAEVIVLPSVPELLAADFQREMKRRRITAMLVPTMVVNHVVREDRDAFAPLRILQVGGDVILPAACRDLLAGQFKGQLYNLYGPAEATTACTAHRITPEDTKQDAIPIGRPLDGVTLYILDPDMNLTEPGESGELYIGGPGIARGYLGQPALTEEKFLPNPFPGGPPRLYRTGDLVRQRPNGVVEYLGRIDDQIKIRGYRVEPGNVERILCRYAHDAVVLSAGTGSDRHLIAFVVLNDAMTTKELRRHAEKELPDFMVPSHFIALPEIPANENGKRDMHSLRELLSNHLARRKRRIAPATATEQYLAALWEELLAVEEVGRHDDFFEIGGHSMLAFRAHKRIEHDFGITMEFQQALSNSILSQLATLIERAREDGSRS